MGRDRKSAWERTGERKKVVIMGKGEQRGYSIQEREEGRERENKVLVMERVKGEIMERERMRREKVGETENVEKEYGRESVEKGVSRRE